MSGSPAGRSTRTPPRSRSPCRSSRARRWLSRRSARGLARRRHGTSRTPGAHTRSASAASCRMGRTTSACTRGQRGRRERFDHRVQGRHGRRRPRGQPRGQVQESSSSTWDAPSRGWSFDPDVPDGADLRPHLRRHTKLADVVADDDWPDVGKHYPDAGNAHGFEWSGPLPAGAQICVVRAEHRTTGRGIRGWAASTVIVSADGPAANRKRSTRRTAGSRSPRRPPRTTRARGAEPSETAVPSEPSSRPGRRSRRRQLRRPDRDSLTRPGSMSPVSNRRRPCATR